MPTGYQAPRGIHQGSVEQAGSGINPVSARLTGYRWPPHSESVRVSVLGPICVDEGAVGLAPRDRLVLTALAVRVGHVVPVEQLAEALWGDEPPQSWGKVVPGCVMRLRRVLGAPAIQTTPGGYRLDRDVVEIDADQFRAQVERGHELLLLREYDRAAHVARQT